MFWSTAVVTRYRDSYCWKSTWGAEQEFMCHWGLFQKGARVHSCRTASRGKVKDTEEGFGGGGEGQHPAGRPVAGAVGPCPAW